MLTAAERTDFRRTIGPLLGTVIEDVARIRDPGEREVVAARLLPDALLEGPDEFITETLDLVAASPRGPELLAGMAVAAPTRVAVGARVQLEELEVPPAPLGRIDVAEAWELVADEPVSALFARCTRQGASGSQLFSFTIEEPLSGGAIKDGFVTETSEGTRFVKRLKTRPPDGGELRPLDPAEAAARIVEAGRRGAATGLAPTRDGLVAAAIFLRASEAEDADAVVQALELGEVLADRIEELEQEAGAAAVEELAAIAETWLAEQGFPDKRVEAGMFATGLMGDFRVHYLGDDLTGWNAAALDEFILDWVPRKVSLRGNEIDEFPGSVADAFRFLGATERLSEWHAATLAERALRHGVRFAEAMADPSLAGPAKTIFDAMSAEGVEIGDEEAMQAWIDDFNARPFEERDRVMGPSLPPAAAPKRPAKAKARKAQKQARRRNRKR